jgi:hypothetical protein
MKRTVPNGSEQFPGTVPNGSPVPTLRNREPGTVHGNHLSDGCDLKGPAFAERMSTKPDAIEQTALLPAKCEALPPDIREAVIEATVKALLLDLKEFPNISHGSKSMVGSPSGSDRNQGAAWGHTNSPCWWKEQNTVGTTRILGPTTEPERARFHRQRTRNYLNADRDLIG